MAAGAPGAGAGAGACAAACAAARTTMCCPSSRRPPTAAAHRPSPPAAPRLRAGGVQGRACTAYPACGPEVTAAGGLMRDVDAAEVVVDGNLVGGCFFCVSCCREGAPGWVLGFSGGWRLVEDCVWLWRKQDFGELAVMGLAPTTSVGSCHAPKPPTACPRHVRAAPAAAGHRARLARAPQVAGGLRGCAGILCGGCWLPPGVTPCAMLPCSCVCSRWGVFPPCPATASCLPMLCALPWLAGSQGEWRLAVQAGRQGHQPARSVRAGPHLRAGSGCTLHAPTSHQRSCMRAR